MNIKDATPTFRAAYDNRLAQLKRCGLRQPKLSSLAKRYARLDQEVARILAEEQDGNGPLGASGLGIETEVQICRKLAEVNGD